mgnify:CR=1 FL=1
MGFRIPSALAGEDNEVELDEDGARTILELVAGTAIGAGILALGGYLFNRAQNVAGTDSGISDLY